MRLFLDASVLTKSYVPEFGTETVLARCAQADEVMFSLIALPEVASALNRIRREGRLSQAAYEESIKRLRDEAQYATVVDLTQSIVDEAIRCLEQWRLRAADAVHVATALGCPHDLFLSADHRQCEAARAAGLNVEEIPPPV